MPTEFAVETQARNLHIGAVAHFATQDRALQFTAVEQALFKVLPDNVILVGIIDAQGLVPTVDTESFSTHNQPFFLEDKTASPKKLKTWRSRWLMSAQALTYGLLTDGKAPFLVRQAFKTNPPTFDHEWFTFTPGDLEFWHRQVMGIAHAIRNSDNFFAAPWPMNINYGCFAYGDKYPCPFWADGCTKHAWDSPIPDALPAEFFPEFDGHNRAVLMKLRDEFPDALFLSQTMIDRYMRCPELYRRLSHVSFPPSEAMLIGKRYHELNAAHRIKLMEAY